MAVVHSFSSLTIGSDEYDFSYLTPFGHTLAGHAREGADLRVRVSFQSHVFARQREAGEEFHIYDESGAARVFCSERYKNSLGLPTFCRRMLDENMLTWESKDRNRISNMAVMDGALKSGEHDVVIYYMFPSQVAGLDVEMVIKSGYRMSVNFDHIKRRYKVVQLAKKCYYERKKIPE